MPTQRPRWLTVNAFLMGLYSLTPYLTSMKDFSAYAVSAIHASVAVSLTVLYFLWRGKNWARIVVLAVSLFMVVGLPMFARDDWAMFGLRIAEALWSVFLLCWLNTARVRAFFKWKADRDTHQPSNA